MTDDPFLLNGEFEIDEERDDELGGTSHAIFGSSNSLPVVLTEREIGKTYYSLEFRQVQSGTFHGEPAWLMVLDAKFHSSNTKDFRFRAVEITLDFGGKMNAGSPGIIKAFAPSTMYGAPVIEQSKWHWEVSGSTNLNLPPATIELANVTVGHSSEYPLRHMLKLQGTDRGNPRSKVVWSVEERKMDGIPPQLPPLALIVAYQPGQILQLSVSLTADTGFSMDPRRWPLFSGPKKVISCDPNGSRRGSSLPNTALESLDMAQYVKTYLSDTAMRPSASAFS